MSAPAPKARVYRLPVYRLSGSGGGHGSGRVWVWVCNACQKNRLGCAHPSIHPSGTWRAAMCGAFRHVHVKHPRTTYDGALTHQVVLGRWRCDITLPNQAQAITAWHFLQNPDKRPESWSDEALWEIVALGDQKAQQKWADPGSTVRFAP